MAATKKTKKIDYKPKIKALQKRKVSLIAQSVEATSKLQMERKVTKMIIKGHSFDSISHRLGISTNEAYEINKAVCKRWITEESLDGPQLRSIQVKQIDAILALASHEAFPHPKLDDNGQPVMVKNCTCVDDEDYKCVIERNPEHYEQAMTLPNKAWVDVYLSILDRKSKLLGLDAAQKLEEDKVDILKRVYQGVDAKVIDRL